MERAQQVRVELARVLSQTVDIETGARGFVVNLGIDQLFFCEPAGALDTPDPARFGFGTELVESEN